MCPTSQSIQSARSQFAHASANSLPFVHLTASLQAPNFTSNLLRFVISAPSPETCLAAARRRPTLLRQCQCDIPASTAPPSATLASRSRAGRARRHTERGRTARFLHPQRQRRSRSPASPPVPAVPVRRPSVHPFPFRTTRNLYASLPAER